MRLQLVAPYVPILEAGRLRALAEGLAEGQGVELRIIERFAALASGPKPPKDVECDTPGPNPAQE